MALILTYKCKSKNNFTGRSVRFFFWKLSLVEFFKNSVNPPSVSYKERIVWIVSHKNLFFTLTNAAVNGETGVAVK